MFNTTPQFNPNPQPQPQAQQQNNPAMQYSLTKLQQTLNAINEFQSQQELQNLLIILRNLQEESINSINLACKSDPNTSSHNEQSLTQTNLTRFKSIKDKNHELLIKVLNLREKMIHQMYMYKVRSPTTENELDHLSEKIRHIKIRVNNKYTQLKFLRMSREGRKQKKQEYNCSPLTIPLDDLKRGAEVLEKESIRLREELSLLVKHLHGEQI